MDRFIGLHTFITILMQIHLKSNMDRFIAAAENLENLIDEGLKSNMDRFIVIVLMKSHVPSRV